jgi:pimeloyl-ACP methyl ester carboxylesterase
MQVVVNGLITSYKKVGSGKKMLLLHGWGDSKETFDQLQKEIDDCQFVSLDLPGFGNTEPPSSPWGLEDYSKFVKEFLLKLSYNPDIIIGHSNGGAIAVTMVANSDIEIKKLILLASSGIRARHKSRKKILRLIAKLIKQPLRLAPRSIQNKVKKRVYKAIGSEIFVAEHLQETFKKIVTKDIREYASRISTPALLIYGSKDTATPPEHGYLLADSFADAQVKIISNAGHFVHHTHLDEVKKCIKDFT